MDILKDLNKAQKKYTVEDLVNEETNIIFILESPHKDELVHRLPVCGKAGKSMSKVLFDENDLALGRYLRKSWREDKHKKIGILNVCNIPMQRSAYYDFEPVHSHFFDYLERIRNSKPQTQHKEKELTVLKSSILIDFEKKIKNVCKTHSNALFIPCGKFANSYFTHVVNSNPQITFSSIKGIPHPSFNHWNRPMYKSEIKKMKELIDIYKS